MLDWIKYANTFFTICCMKTICMKTDNETASYRFLKLFCISVRHHIVLPFYLKRCFTSIIAHDTCLKYKHKVLISNTLRPVLLQEET